MQIIVKKIEELKPYERNPRRNDGAVKYLVKSIQEFGFKQPIVVDKNNVIVAGHTRYKAAKQLEMKEVPCVVADDLTDEQIKAYRLADNKIAEIAEWDFETLNIELEDLIVDGFEMGDFGFISIDDKEADFEDFFDEAPTEPKEEKEKEIQCPHCGMWFKQ